jgi:hypothetical protein
MKIKTHVLSKRELAIYENSNEDAIALIETLLNKYDQILHPIKIGYIIAINFFNERKN